MYTYSRFHASSLEWIGIVVLLLATGVPAPVEAQLNSAILYGRVTDETGGVLPGVQITVTSPQLIKASQTVVTEERGQWRVPVLPPGTYTVTAELSGFAGFTRQSIVLEAGDQIRVDIQMALSTVQESVTVTGERSVDVRTTQLTSTIPEEIVANIPLGRSFHDVLTWTLPTVTDGGRYTYDLVLAAGGSGYQEEERNLDGHTAAGTEFSTESLEEVQVTIAGLDAEYGTRSAGVFNFITKSGGNRFSGSLYGYLVDETLSADNLTDDLRAQGLEQSNVIVRDSQFGGNLGGPILKDRLWFFVDINKLHVAETFAGFTLSDITNDRLMGFGKVTWQVSPNHKVTCQGDCNRGRCDCRCHLSGSVTCHLCMDAQH